MFNKRNYPYMTGNKIATPAGKISIYKDEKSLPNDEKKLYWMARYYYHQYRFVQSGKNDWYFKVTEIIYKKYFSLCKENTEEYSSSCEQMVHLYERYYGIENENTKTYYLKYMESSLLHKHGKPLFWSLYMLSTLLFKYFNETLEILYQRIEQDKQTNNIGGIECFDILMSIYPMKLNGRHVIENKGTKVYYISKFFTANSEYEDSMKALQKEGFFFAMVDNPDYKIQTKEIIANDQKRLQSLTINDCRKVYDDLRKEMIQQRIEAYHTDIHNRRKLLFEIIMLEKDFDNFDLKDSIVQKLPSDEIYDIVEMGCVLSYFDKDLALPYTSLFTKLPANETTKEMCLLLMNFGSHNAIFNNNENLDSKKISFDLRRYYQSVIYFHPHLAKMFENKIDEQTAKKYLVELAKIDYLDSQEYLNIILKKEEENKQISEKREQIYSLDLPIEEKVKILVAVYKSMDINDQKSEFFITQCIGYEDKLDLMYALIPSFGMKGLGILIKGLIIYLKANAKELGPKKELDICNNIIKQLSTKEPKEYTSDLGYLAIQYALLYYQVNSQGASAKNLYQRIVAAVKGDEEGLRRLACYFREISEPVFLALYLPIVQSWIKTERYADLFKFYYQLDQYDKDEKKEYKMQSLIDYDKAYDYLDQGEYSGDGECYLLDYYYRSSSKEDLITAMNLGCENAYWALENLRIEQQLRLDDLRRKAAIQQQALEMKLAEEQSRRRMNLEINESLANLALTGEAKTVDQIYYEGRVDEVSYWLYQDWKEKKIKGK